MKYRKNVILFTLFAMNLVDQPAPEVKIAQGVLSGKISTDGTIFEYLGIPYGTTENRRFQAPGPPPSWEGVFQAIDDIYMCPQNIGYAVVGTEDCLKINVYVPAKAARPLPVMVWIHGGAFILGSGGKLLYTPDFIVKKDVILVTLNYRLGALGFLCLGIQGAPGNAGLKDQIAALRWVKSNIAAFGGDPDNITLFGESAGATSTALLLASYATEGLFNRAIVQSGSSIANWSINRKPVWVASLLAQNLGYNTTDPQELYKIFSVMDFKDLMSINAKKPLDLFFETQLLHLPCVENVLPGVEVVINDLPYNMINKKPKDIPLIFGSTSREGLFLISKETNETLDERNGRYLFASDLNFSSEVEAKAVADKIHKFYFNEDRVNMAKVMNVSDLYTHLFFELPAIFETEAYLNKIKSPVYNYVFNYSGGRNFMKVRSGYPEEPGSCHGDDLAYLFNGYFIPKKITEEDGKVIEYFTTMWTNFAKYGDPTPKSRSNVPITWEASTRGNMRFLYIENELRMGSLPNPDAYRLWKDTYQRYRKVDV